MSEPKATALMCAFNAQETIAASLRALLRQTEQDVEVVVVDDASEDSTPEILGRLSDPRIRVLRNASRLGIAPSRNRAISEARAPVLLIADSDDEFPEHRIKAQLEFLAASVNVAMVGGFAEAVDEEGARLGILRSPPGIEAMRAARVSQSPLLHCTLAVRTEAVRAVGGYREKFLLASDYDLLCRLVEGFGAATMPEVLCRYRVSRDSSTVRRSAVSASCVAAAKRFARERAILGEDSYEEWGGVLDSGPRQDFNAGQAYHLLAGKIAAAHGNTALARRHFAAAGLIGLPYLGATLLGPSAYRRIQGTFGGPQP